MALSPIATGTLPSVLLAKLACSNKTSPTCSPPSTAQQEPEEENRKRQRADEEAASALESMIGSSRNNKRARVTELATTVLASPRSFVESTHCSAKLTLSSPKIYKYGSYWMILSISSQFRKQLGLSGEDVISAGLAGQCRRVGKPQEEVVCEICKPSSSVVSVTEATEKTYPEQEMEEYRFTLRSNCTSSRDHLKAMLVMEVQLAATVCLLSPSFVLRARKKPSRAAFRNPLPMVEHVEAPSTQSRTPSLLPEQMSLAALNARSPSSSISPRSVNFATRALCVRATDAEWRTLFDHFVILARQIPGVVDVGTAFVANPPEPQREAMGIAILTLAYSTTSTNNVEHQFFSMLGLYLANLAPGYNNLYSMDMLSTGAVSVVPWPF